MDTITHAPGGPQQPLPGDASFIGAIRGRAAIRNPTRPTVASKQCFYCEDTGHFKERCPLRLKDILAGRKAANRPTRGRANPRASPLTRSRAGPTATSQWWNPPEARYTTPVVTDGYAATSNPRRISTIEEHAETEETAEAVEDTYNLDDVDFTMLDEATIAALYEELKDLPIENSTAEEKDFVEGQ